MRPEDERFPTQAELNEDDARDLYRIIDWIHANGMAAAWMVGEQPVDYIIRLLGMCKDAQKLLSELREVVEQDWALFPHPEHGERRKYVLQGELLHMLDPDGDPVQHQECVKCGKVKIRVAW